MDQTTAPAAPDSVEELYRLIGARVDALPKRLRQCADFIARNPDRVAVSTVAELAAARRRPALGDDALLPGARLLRLQPDAAPVPRRVLAQVARLRDPPAEPARLRRAAPRRPARRVRRGRPRLAREPDDDRRPRPSRARGRHPRRRAGDPPRRLPPRLPGRELPRLCAREDGDPLRAPLRRRPPATAHALRPGDAVLAITFAPYSAETVAFAEAARAAGHPVVAITDSLSSPLQRLDVLPAPRLRGRCRRLPRALGHLRPRHRARGRRSAPGARETPPAADFRVPRTERIFYF